jgi:23S rRNA maturation mini-RNase III
MRSITFTSTIEPIAAAGVEQAVKARTDAAAANVLINMELSKVMVKTLKRPRNAKGVNEPAA